MEDFTELVKTLKAYDWGKSGAPLLAVDAEIRKVAGQPARAAKLEDALLEVLKSDAAVGAKRGVCKSLSLIATDRSAPVLAGMLTKSETSDMARYVLERMPPGAADGVLRGAVRETRGRICVGIVNAIGNRRDAQAVRVLSDLLADADEEVAQAAARALGRVGGTDAIRRLSSYKRVARAGVRAEVLDAYLVCAGRLAAEGKKSEAAAMYKELSAEGVSAPVRRAAERALKGLAALAVLVVAVAASSIAAPADDAKTVRFTKKRLFVNNYQAASVADINRDGKPDIVSGAYWFSGPDFEPHAFRANEGAKDWINSNSDLPYDVDGDRWPDIIVGAWGQDGILWYRNPGPLGLKVGTPWEKGQLSPTKGKIERTDLHDYNGDGVPEIHTMSYVKTEPSDVYRLVKRGPKPVVEKFVLGSQGAGHGYAWGDVNNDGREDFLTEVGWYERPAGDPFAAPWKLHPESALPHPSCPFAVLDVNRDGRLDILFGKAHDYGLWWWEQMPPKPDGTTVWKEHVIDTSWSQVHVVGLADLDGDGFPELVTGKCVYAHTSGDPGLEDPAVFYYYKWNAAQSKFVRHTIAGPGEEIGLGRQLTLADLNGDGRIDIVAPGRWGLWVMLNEGVK